MKRLRFLCLSLLFPIVFLSTLVIPSVASAASTQASLVPQGRLVLASFKTTAIRPPAARAAYTCGTNCNDVNPQGTSCAQGAQTILTAYIIDSLTGGTWGLVELRWSPTCGTNWSRLTSYVGQHQLYALIIHPGNPPNNVDGGFESYSSQFQFATQTWSNMVYSPDDPVEATGVITIGRQNSNCVANPPLPRNC